VLLHCAAVKALLSTGVGFIELLTLNVVGLVQPSKETLYTYIAVNGLAVLFVNVSPILPVPLPVAGVIPATEARVHEKVALVTVLAGVNVNSVLLHVLKGPAAVKVGLGLTVSVILCVLTQVFAVKVNA
jgi:hypothetical protein